MVHRKLEKSVSLDLSSLRGVEPMKGLLVVIMLLVPTTAFGQTAQEEYQKAKAAEFRSDNSTDHTEREIYISEAFGAITEAAIADARYVDVFAAITRKYVVRSKDPYFQMVGVMVRVGEKRASSPAFKSVSAEVARAYQKILLQKGFGPGKPFKQVRRSGHCNVPYAAENIFRLLQFAHPSSAEVVTWGRYAGDIHMTKLLGCGGEGSDTEGDPLRAFHVYVAIGHRPGMYRAGKMLGDERMERYIFGGFISEDSKYGDSGHRPFFEGAMKYYREGGVARNEIRATILLNLRKAEKLNSPKAIKVAQKTLEEMF